MRNGLLCDKIMMVDGMKTDNENKKIEESKQVIKKEKEKIRIQRKNIRKKKLKNFKKTKFGAIIGKVLLLDDSYSFSQVFIIVIISLALGAFACLSLFTILAHGKNYFKLGRELSKFYDVYEVLLDNYYGHVDKDKLVEAAINGMVSSVGDEYTNYSDIDEADSFNEMLSGKYEGIGCTITLKDEMVSVVSVYEGSPAEKAGIKEGDIIKEVDKHVASKMGVNKIAEYIKTEASSDITMIIVRDKEEMEIILKRDIVEMPMVSGKIFTVSDKKVGYINISLFSSVVSKQFKNKLTELESEGIDALVIDVRNNNGGYLSSVSDILSSLLPKGVTLYQVQKDNKREVTKDKTSEKREYPIAVITNENSASASEILAAAIKESYKGFVVGTKTYGKGTMQQVKKLSDGSLIKYTTQNWLTPEGNWINEVGIKPTDEVKLSENYYKNPTEENDNQLQMALNLVSK